MSVMNLNVQLVLESPVVSLLCQNKRAGYGYRQKVYENVRALWRTQQLVSKNSVVIFPEAYRDWIEQVYQEEPWQDDAESNNRQRL